MAEIHRLGDHPQFVQVQLPSASRIPWGQRIFHPIYEAASEYGLAIAIHPGSEGVGLSGPPNAAGYPTSYFEWHTTLVNSYIAHVTSMLAEGVFARVSQSEVCACRRRHFVAAAHSVADGQELESAALNHSLAE